MRSKFLVCAAIAAVGASGSFISAVHAAEAKNKGASAKSSDSTKKPLELHADDKSIKKQTQWEDRVMGPDSKRTELEKIARARAINEKAEKDKEKQAAFEATAPAPKAAPPSKKNEKSEVSLLSSDKGDSGRAHEISPKLETAAAQAPVAPSKPADDKFIDKLLREEDAPSKKRASNANDKNDKELENLLAGAKEKPHKKGDSVDDLIKSADKGPAMPAPRAQNTGLPEWAKQPEIAPTPAPAPAPVAVKATPKKPDSGVIQVVQGAAGNAPAVVPPARSAPVATRAGRKAPGTLGSKSPVAANWSDPFADKRPVASAQASKKEPASRPAASTDTSWNDPFANDPGETRKAVRHSTPTSTTAPSAPVSAPKKSEPAGHPNGNGGWKDPFTKASSEPTRSPVAMRELGKNESSKWEIAARRPVAHATASDTHAAGGWGVLKKRAR